MVAATAVKKFLPSADPRRRGNGGRRVKRGAKLPIILCSIVFFFLCCTHVNLGIKNSNRENELFCDFLHKHKYQFILLPIIHANQGV